jgi:hypothetical protein
MQQNWQHLITHLPFAKPNKLCPLPLLLGNLTPAMHVHTVEVNNIQHEHIHDTHITKYTKKCETCNKIGSI